MATPTFKPLDVEPDSSRSAVVILNYPVQLADRQLAEVTMRRPNMGDLLDHEPKAPDDVASELELIGILCGLKPSEMRLLDATDYARLQDQYVRFRAVPKP
ncbi:phage tail assembly protein [uncultured Desulfovibrio sp.]|uniref:phage tail assembly protein n=1 Tax=uncultured Desulfovibrio sp. TaxID=167968 RepID=UPI00261EEB39|nr:phage tail assembly protein [uncultured Desulfovibrio sp.]